MPAVIILAGLGNPGPKYAHHRHNVGFLAVDAIADAHGFGPPRKKFQAEIREGYLDGPGGRQKAVALKPATFMNESGRAVGEAMRFYKAEPGDVVVFHDELDLAPGKLRVKTGGGTAGHNGLRSIDAHIGPEFRRVRIGIGHPGDKAKVTGHVLGDFAKSDREWLDPLLKALAEAAPFLVADDARFMSDVAHRLAPPKAPAAAKKEPSAEAAATAEHARAGETEKPARGPLAEALHKLLGRKD
jgi:PTH1 family peptidyl-tRNA hydrolase